MTTRRTTPTSAEPPQESLPGLSSAAPDRPRLRHGRGDEARAQIVPQAHGQVLKPGGRLLFCEHGLAPDASVARWQNRLTPCWKPLAGGCQLNRDIPALPTAGGFSLGQLQTGYLNGHRPMTFVYRGWTE